MTPYPKRLSRVPNRRGRRGSASHGTARHGVRRTWSDVGAMHNTPIYIKPLRKVPDCDADTICGEPRLDVVATCWAIIDEAAGPRCDAAAGGCDAAAGGSGHFPSASAARPAAACHIPQLCACVHAVRWTVTRMMFWAGLCFGAPQRLPTSLSLSPFANVGKFFSSGDGCLTCRSVPCSVQRRVLCARKPRLRPASRAAARRGSAASFRPGARRGASIRPGTGGEDAVPPPAALQDVLPMPRDPWRWLPRTGGNTCEGALAALPEVGALLERGVLRLRRFRRFRHDRFAETQRRRACSTRMQICGSPCSSSEQGSSSD